MTTTLRGPDATPPYVGAVYERLERTQRARWVVHEDLGAGVWRLRRQRAARRQQLERSTAQLRDEASWRFVGIATLPLPGMER